MELHPSKDPILLIRGSRNSLKVVRMPAGLGKLKTVKLLIRVRDGRHNYSTHYHRISAAIFRTKLYENFSNLCPGKHDLRMCELSLTQTGLTSRKGAEIFPNAFDEVWNKCGGANLVRK